MTRKDYTAIAGMFGRLYRDVHQCADHPYQPAVLRCVDSARREMESILKSDNGRFDVERFKAEIARVAKVAGVDVFAGGGS